jgi:hypothetical protein
MIIDTEPSESPKRHWPFLLAWSLAAIAIVLALFLTQTPASQQASVAVSASQAPSTSASVSRSVIVQQLPVGLYTTVQRIDSGRKPFISILDYPNSVIYLDNGGLRIAVELEDNLLIEGPRGSTTHLR